MRRRSRPLRRFPAISSGNTTGAPALFRDGEEEPLEVYSTPMEEINPADAAKLAEGIRLRGISEVNRLLEDLEIR